MQQICRNRPGNFGVKEIWILPGKDVRDWFHPGRAGAAPRVLGGGSLWTTDRAFRVVTNPARCALAAARLPPWLELDFAHVRVVGHVYVCDDLRMARILACAVRTAVNQYGETVREIERCFRVFGAPVQNHRGPGGPPGPAVPGFTREDAQLARRLTQRARAQSIATAIDLSAAQRTQFWRRQCFFDPPPLTTAEQHALIKFDLREDFEYHAVYGVGVAALPPLTPDFVLAFEHFAERYGRAARAWAAWAELGPGAAATARRAACMATWRGTLEGATLVGSRGDGGGWLGPASLANEARRNILAYRLLVALGFDGPFSDQTYNGEVAWRAGIDGQALRHEWMHGGLWIQEGLAVEDARYRVEGMPVAGLVNVVSAWLKEWWGVSVGLRFSLGQVIKPRSRARDAAAQAADAWGAIHWWRDAIPAPRRVADENGFPRNW
jgi:hypothetical protein